MDEKLLRDLVDELQDLTRTLRTTSGTGTTGSGVPGLDRGINQLINALGKLTSKLDGTQKSRAEEQKSMRRFAADVERATTAQEKQKDAIEKNIEAQKQASAAAQESARRAALTQKQRDEEDKQRAKAAAQQAKASAQAEKAAKNREIAESINTYRRQTTAGQEVFDSIQGVGGASGLLKEQFFRLGGDSIGAQLALQGLAAAAEGASTAFINYTKSIQAGERGAKLSAQAFSDLVKPLTDFTSVVGGLMVALSLLPIARLGKLARWAIGIGGAALGLGSEVVDKAAELNKVAAEQMDNLFRSFNILSESGVATAGGIEDVRANMQMLGMSLSEIDTFTQFVSQSSKNLAMMGVTAGEGLKLFSDVAGTLYKSDLGRQLEMLGVTAENQREAAMAYLTIQARTGQLQMKNTQQLVQETYKFTRELDLAAQLTGQTRKEQAAAREAALADERFRAAMIAEQAAARQGDPGAQERLARLERARDIAAIVERFDKTAATGIRQLAAGQGAMATPEAVAAAMSYGLHEALRDPNMPLTEALRIMSQRAGQNLEALAGSNRFLGTIAGYQTDIVGQADFVEKIGPIIAAARAQGLSEEALLAALAKARAVPEPTTQTMVDAQRMQQSQALLQDAILQTFAPAVKIHKSATELFQKTVKEFGDIVGAMPVPGGTPVGPTGATRGRPYAGPNVAQPPVSAPAGSTVVSTGMPSVAAAGGSAIPPMGRDALAGLTIKNQESTAGPAVNYSPKLIELARLIQQNVPGFRYFSSFSDKYHGEEAPGSKHNQGLALDFTLGHWPSKAESASITAFLKASGASYVKDEYYDPSKKSTGGHYHVEVPSFALGGITSGPKSGYNAVLHGTEAVVPLPDGKTIPVNMNADMSGLKPAMEQVTKAISDLSTKFTSGPQIEMLNSQIGRLDELVAAMREQNSIASKILRATNN